jgi:hypothetical protein
MTREAKRPPRADQHVRDLTLPSILAYLLAKAMIGIAIVTVLLSRSVNRIVTGPL